MLVLIGRLWGTGAGLPADAVADLVRPEVGSLSVRHLTDPVLWGRPTDDERSLEVAHKQWPTECSFGDRRKDWGAITEK